MASLIPGYEYDIFISYRQKDNKGDRWVSEFVEAFKTELESTFKEEIRVYFDVNPHDGLLETHDVDASLKEKLKCLVFIPIISRTYCDPKSFAWEHEFRAFIEQASQDKFGLKVRLPNGNVASRVLPVRIHDLDNDDVKLCESILGGVLRGVEFIYKEAGVNRPLRSKEDNPGDNLNKTFYRNQVNKVANAVKEIILGLKAGPSILIKESFKQSETSEEAKKAEKKSVNKKSGFLNNRKLLSGVLIASILVIAAILAYPRIFKRNPIERLRSSGEKISVSVMPFRNMTKDTIWDVYQDLIQDRLISKLNSTGDLKVVFKETMDNFMNTKGLTEYSSISPSIAGSIARKLETDIFINGSIKQAGSKIILSAQLIYTKSNEVFRSFFKEGPANENNIIQISDSLSQDLVNFFAISKLIKENPVSVRNFSSSTNSPVALKEFIYGSRALGRADFSTAIKCFENAMAADSNFISPMLELTFTYRNSGKINKAPALAQKLYKKRDQMSPVDQLRTDYIHALYFEPIDVRINLLKQLQEIDVEGNYHRLLAGNYTLLNQPDKAISEREKALEIWRKWGKEFLIGNPDYAALGEAYHRTGQYKKAKRLYREAERVNDDHTTTYFSWIIRDQASLELTLGDTVAANRYIKELLSVLKLNSFSEAEIAAQLALMYKSAGNLDKAEEFYRTALSLEPESTQRLNSLATFLIVNDRKVEESLEIINKALKLKPGNGDYLDTKGMGLYKLGKYSEALELLEKARDLKKPLYSYEISSHIEEVKKAIAGQK
jgi:tetratricopeptide (TPR) repeat protein